MYIKNVPRWLYYDLWFASPYTRLFLQLLSDRVPVCREVLLDRVYTRFAVFIFGRHRSKVKKNDENYDSLRLWSSVFSPEFSVRRVWWCGHSSHTRATLERWLTRLPRSYHTYNCGKHDRNNYSINIMRETYYLNTRRVLLWNVCR